MNIECFFHFKVTLKIIGKRAQKSKNNNSVFSPKTNQSIKPLQYNKHILWE